MKRLLYLIALLPFLSLGQSSDAALTTQANVIRNETAPGGNTKTRIADMFQGLIDSKPSLLGSYSDPSWITGLAWSKITSAPPFISSYPGAGIAVSTGSAWGTSITDNSANWNTAFGWGNHAGLYPSITGSGLSVLGVTGNASANMASIVAGTNGHVLRRSGTTLGFGTLASGAFATNTIARDVLVDGSGLSVIGRSANTSGAVADISASGGDGFVLRRNGASIGFGTLVTASFASNTVPHSALSNVGGNTILGKSTSGSGAVDQITAVTDGHVLRLSGTTLGFGTLASTAFANGTIPVAANQNLATYGVMGSPTNTGQITDIIAASDNMILRRSGASLGFGQIVSAGITDGTITNDDINTSAAIVASKITGTTAEFNTALSDNDFATLAGSESLTNKTFALGSNTLSGTLAEFNTALTGADFATGGGTATGTNTGDQSLANTSDATSHTVTLTGGTSVQLIEGSNITLTTGGTGGAGTVTIASTGGGGGLTYPQTKAIAMKIR